MPKFYGYDTQDLEKALTTDVPYPLDRYKGQGVLFCGGGRYLPSAYLALRSLRLSGCTLPAQLWYLGPTEFPIRAQPLFSCLDCELVDAFQVRQIFPFPHLGGWELKPYAMTHCRFLEVLSIDADNFVLHDPTALFENKLFKEAGALFWPDFITKTLQPWSIKPLAWEVLAIPPRANAEIESGQVLINKEKIWKTWQVVLHMNARSDFYYPHCTYGDNNVYPLAWFASKKEPPTVSHRPRLMDELVRIQFSPEGAELFQHGRKWVLPSAKNFSLPSYRFENQALEWLREFEQALYG